MKWPETKQTASRGVIYVENMVNEHGSIFRQVHQETDVGIDGHIELIHAGNTTGKLVAIQIKSGDSYVDETDEKFNLRVDQEHLDYWCSYILPVVIVCYSPSRDVAAWTSVCDYVRHEEYHGRPAVSHIDIPFRNQFNVDSLSGEISDLANIYADRRVLVNCIDYCLAGTSREKLQGLTILAAHPDSCDSRIKSFIARHLLFDPDDSIATEATRILAYDVGRIRWSWNPNNSSERGLIDYASELCRDLSKEDCHKLIARVDNAWFSGPDAMGERVLDILACCEEAQAALEEVVVSNALPMQRRINSLYMLYGGDDEELLGNRELLNDPNIGDVYRAMYAEELSEET